MEVNRGFRPSFNVFCKTESNQRNLLADSEGY